MPRYYFDIHRNGEAIVDGEGHDLASTDDVRHDAMAVLPHIASDTIVKDGDNQNFIVVVREESGRVVYTATLSYVGLKLV